MVEENALDRSVTVGRTPDLSIERRTLCNWAIAALFAFPQEIIANGGFVGKETLAFYKSLFAAPEVGTSHVGNLWALINFANQLWLPHYCSGQLIMWHSVHVKPNSPSAPWFVNTRDRPKLRRSICPKRLYAGWLVSDLPENELIWNSRMKYRVWIKALENNLFFC